MTENTYEDPWWRDPLTGRYLLRDTCCCMYIQEMLGHYVIRFDDPYCSGSVGPIGSGLEDAQKLAKLTEDHIRWMRKQRRDNESMSKM